MNIKDRKTLKSYFRKGCIPTEEQFAELIDSVHNIMEDGRIIRTAEGWAFYPDGNKPLQLCLHNSADGNAVWTVHITPEKSLAVKNADGDTVVEMMQDKSVVLPGMKPQEEGGPDIDPEPKPDPQTDGAYYITVDTDRKWHDIAIAEKKGLNMFNAFMLLYDQNAGTCKTTFVMSYCMNTVECYIKSPQKHWWGWSGGLNLKWNVKDGKPCLQVRSKQYRKSGKIFCKIW